jgi:branched-chain amino acid transport system ATP-binding protein
MPTSSADGTLRKPPFLAVDQLTAGYGAVPVINDISVGVGIGEVVAIIGPNGAGKSTLLKAVMGSIRVMSGRVRLGEEDVTRLSADDLARKGIGYVPQLNAVFDGMTVAENLEMGGYLLPRESVSSRIEEVVSIFPPLTRILGRGAGKLSGGERKMLAVARALMLHPRVLVLDEPTSNLSHELSRRLLEDHVRRLADLGTAVFLVEQKALAALEIADWAYVLAAGTVRLSSQATQLLKRPDLADVFLGLVEKKPGQTSPTSSQAAEVPRVTT